MIRRTFLRIAVTIVSAIVAANILYFISDKINVLERFSVALNDIDFTDMYYQIEKSAPKDTSIVIVNISIIPREEIGRLIHKISTFKPKVIGADIFFSVDNDSLNPTGTDTLVQQIKNVNNLILVSAYRGQNKTGRDSIETQSPRVREYAKEGIANFNIPKDDPEYGTLRSFSPFVKINDSHHLSFSFLIASYYDSTFFKYASHDDMYIKWYGYAYTKNHKTDRREVFKSFEWSEVMNGAVSKDDFANKIVLLGYLGNEIGSPSTDVLFYSPMNHKIIGRSTPDIYGVEVHANAIKMIIDKDFIRQSWLIDATYSLLIAVIFVLALNWLKVKHDKLYPVVSKIMLLLIINLFVFVVVAIFYNTEGRVKILIGDAIVILLIIPDIFEFLTDNVFKRIKLE